VRELTDVEVSVLFHRVPATVDRADPYVRTLSEVVAEGSPTPATGAGETAAERISVGRDGASDAVSFLAVGVPAVEFGPLGGGHHGPDEWVSVASLERYKSALVDFVHRLPRRLELRPVRVA
jgi:succinyl-diaminopimelate desuccinylase